MTAAALALTAALAGILPSPTSSAPRVEHARYLMGTLCTAWAESADTAAAGPALTAALNEIDRLERVMSSWRDDSELSGFNRAAGGGPVPCSPDLAAVLDSALVLVRMTDGAFDPTIEPLMSAWDMRGAGRVPGAAALAAARNLVGWPGLELDREARTAALARSGMGVDLGGIGKGFALDRAAATLVRRGVICALVNLGGELMVLGGRESIAVAHPARRLEPAVEITVANAAVSTSGQAERGFNARGRRYGHILDPRTGRPTPTEATVTVVCRSATRADALATALLILGRERAAAFARAHGDIGVLWLEPAGSGVRAWCWNLPDVRAASGAVVQWMDRSELTTRTP